MVDKNVRLIKLRTVREYFVDNLKRIHGQLLYLEYVLDNGAFYAPMPWLMSVLVTDDEITMGVRFHDGKGNVLFMPGVIIFRMSSSAKKKLNIKAFATDAMFDAYLDRLVSEIKGLWRIGDDK